MSIPQIAVPCLLLFAACTTASKTTSSPQEPAATKLKQAQEDEELSADKVARSLANPNTPLATLTVKNQFRTFQGDLPRAEAQESFTMLLQPSFPFATGDEGDVVFWRPAVPVMFSQPVPDLTGEFDQKTDLGDIGFDLGLGSTSKTGQLSAYGIVTSFPTATDPDLSSKNWTLGPEFLLAQFESWGVYGIFPNHQWDVAGWSDRSVNLSSTQVFLTCLPGGGWNVGTTPLITYDWQGSDWTVPVNVSLGRTIMLGKTPVRLGFEVNYYVETPDAFGPEWMIGFNVSPVVENVLSALFR